MYRELLLPEVRQMVDEHDVEGMREFCEVFHPAVTADVLDCLSGADAWRVMRTCNPDRQVEILEFMSLPKQVGLTQHMDRNRLARLLEEMAPDDRVDLLGRMNPQTVETLLPSLAQAERSDIRKLLSYPDDSAGSIMTTEYASLPGDVTVGEALDRLRKQAPDRETIYYIYILDEGRRLLGFVSLRELILAKPDSKLSDIMKRDVISVRVTDDQEQVAQELARYDFIAMPVVDNQNRLVGIITHDDVLDVVREEATEDVQRLAGMEPLEDSYLTTPLRTLTWKRGVWLVVLLSAALGTATIVSGFQDVAESQTWMVLFLPMVIASGGNSGSQSATLVIRTLALGEIGRATMIRMMAREVLLASQMAAVLSLLSFGFALLFESVRRSAVVAATVFLVVTFGAVIGALLPLGFKRMGMDPALMSTPLIAAISDMLGVVIYFNVAILLLR
jgi:magnesium transporter